MKKWKIKAQVIIPFEKEINANSVHNAIEQFKEVICQDLKEKGILYDKKDILIDEKNISMSDE